MGHSYLFVGSQGSGRFAMAVAMAAALNCQSGEVGKRHCDCRSCRQIFSLQHPNLTLLIPLPKAKSKKEEEKRQGIFSETIKRKAEDLYRAVESIEIKSGQIMIDQIRDLRLSLSMVQDQAGIRVIIINPANKLNEQAANALLKHLEEPPDNCIMLLTCESKRDMLPTIVSRCQTIAFSPLPLGVIKTALIDRGAVNAEVAATAAGLADGNMTLAIELSMEESQEKLKDTLNFLRAAVTGKIPSLVSYIDVWGRLKSRRQVKERLNYISIWVNDALKWKAFSSVGNVSDESIIRESEVIKRIATLYSIKQLSESLALLEEAKLAIDSNVIIPLALTVLGIKLQRVLR